MVNQAKIITVIIGSNLTLPKLHLQGSVNIPHTKGNYQTVNKLVLQSMAIIFYQTYFSLFIFPIHTDTDTFQKLCHHFSRYMNPSRQTVPIKHHKV